MWSILWTKASFYALSLFSRIRWRPPSGDYQRYAEIERQMLSSSAFSKGWLAGELQSQTLPLLQKRDLLPIFILALLFLLPPEKALALAEATSDLETIIASADGKLYISSGLEGRIQMESRTWEGSALAEV